MLPALTACARLLTCSSSISPCVVEGTVPESRHLPFVWLPPQVFPWPPAPGSPSREAALELWSPKHKASRTIPAERPPHHPLPLPSLQPCQNISVWQISVPFPTHPSFLSPPQRPGSNALFTKHHPCTPEAQRIRLCAFPGQPQQDASAWVRPRSLHGGTNRTPGHSRNPR